MRHLLILGCIAGGFLALLPNDDPPPPPTYVVSFEDGTPVRDFLRQVEQTTGARFVWTRPLKQLDRARLVAIGTGSLEGSRVELLQLVCKLLTFYELDAHPIGPQVFQVSQRFHTCGLRAGQRPK